MLNYVKLCSAWGVHLFTASSGIIALLAFDAIALGNFNFALQLIYLTVLIDAVDGVFARKLQVAKLIPNFDGALLDYIIDFTTWVILPAFFLLKCNKLPDFWAYSCAVAIVLSSAYQFCCRDLKNQENTFKRWPSAWSVVIVCFILWDLPDFMFVPLVFLLSLLSFVPIYFIHSLRFNLFSDLEKKKDFLLSLALIIGSILFNLSVFFSVYHYPEKFDFHLLYQKICVLVYFFLSFLLTFQYKSSLRRQTM